MKIAMIIACKAEFNAIINKLEKVRVIKKGSFVFYEAYYKKKKIFLIQSGIGKTSASFCCQKLIDTFKFDLLLNIGSCAGFKGFDIGDVLLIDKCYFWDFKQIFMPEEFSQISVDKKILNFAQNVLQDVKITSLATGDDFVEDKDTKNKIMNDYNAFACDMEGMAISQVCFKNKTKFLLIKCVSDNGEDAQMFNDNIKYVSEKVASSALKIIEKVSRKDL